MSSKRLSELVKKSIVAADDLVLIQNKFDESFQVSVKDLLKSKIDDKTIVNCKGCSFPVVKGTGCKYCGIGA